MVGSRLRSRAARTQIAWPPLNSPHGCKHLPHRNYRNQQQGGHRGNVMDKVAVKYYKYDEAKQRRLHRREQDLKGHQALFKEETR